LLDGLDEDAFAGEQQGKPGDVEAGDVRHFVRVLRQHAEEGVVVRVSP